MSQSQNAPREWANGKIVFADAAQFAAHMAEQGSASLSDAQVAQIAQVVAQVVAQVIQPQVAPEPKVQEVRQTKRKVAPKVQDRDGDLVRYIQENGHKVTVDDSKRRTDVKTGWQIAGPVTVFDGDAITDAYHPDGLHRSVPDLGDINELLECRKHGCFSNRHGQNMYCLDHKRMARSAGVQWRKAGKPRTGTKAHREYMAELPTAIRNA